MQCDRLRCQIWVSDRPANKHAVHGRFSDSTLDSRPAECQEWTKGTWTHRRQVQAFAAFVRRRPNEFADTLAGDRRECDRRLLHAASSGTSGGGGPSAGAVVQKLTPTRHKSIVLRYGRLPYGAVSQGGRSFSGVHRRRISSLVEPAARLGRRAKRECSAPQGQSHGRGDCMLVSGPRAMLRRK